MHSDLNESPCIRIAVTLVIFWIPPLCHLLGGHPAPPTRPEYLFQTYLPAISVAEQRFGLAPSPVC